MVNPISSFSGMAQQQAVASARDKVQAAIQNIASGLSSQDVATVAVASQLQAETNGLRTVSGNLAQAFSLTQVADGGVGQIQDIVGQLQSLARQAASPTDNAANRAQLNQQFQQLADQVDQIASGASFNNQPLLNGSLSGNNSLTLDSLLGGSGSGTSLAIGNLGSAGLFGNQSLNVLSPESAGAALSVLTNAMNDITGSRAGIGAFQQTLSYAAANVDSALINQEAAQSTLSETDLAAASTNDSLANIQQNAAIAEVAQGNKLSPALLQLIG